MSVPLHYDSGFSKVCMSVPLHYDGGSTMTVGSVR